MPQVRKSQAFKYRNNDVKSGEGEENNENLEVSCLQTRTASENANPAGRNGARDLQFLCVLRI